MIEFESINISIIGRVGAYMVGYNMGIIFYEFRKSKPISENKIYRAMSKRFTRVMIVFCSFTILGLMACYVSSHTLS